jgi:hypothetical protein
VTLQASLRRLMAVKRFHRMKKAAVAIQAKRRSFSAFRRYFYSRKWVVKQQSLARGVTVRTKVKGMVRAAVAIQRAYGGFKIKAKFKNSIEQVRFRVAARPAARFLTRQCEVPWMLFFVVLVVVAAAFQYFFIVGCLRYFIFLSRTLSHTHTIPLSPIR